MTTLTVTKAQLAQALITIANQPPPREHPLCLALEAAMPGDWELWAEHGDCVPYHATSDSLYRLDAAGMAWLKQVDAWLELTRQWPLPEIPDCLTLELAD